VPIRKSIIIFLLPILVWGFPYYSPQGVSLRNTALTKEQTPLALINNNHLIVADFSKKAKEYLQERVRVNKFSGVVLVALDGKPILREAYGLANCEYDIPNTPETRFRLGSVSKMFTAAAILMLEQKHMLNVNASVSEYLTDWPQNWSAVTIHHLLSHTAGLPPLSYPASKVDVGGLDLYRAKPPQSLSDLYKPGEELQALDFVPGQKFAYSNMGYIILGIIIEKVSGKLFSQFMKEEIFEPVRMTNTDCEDPNRIVKQKANGYFFLEDKLFSAAYVDMRFTGGAGAMYSTADDLLKWNNALQTDLLLSPEARKKMLSPHLSNYAYGWWIQNKFNQKIQWHRGNVSGFVAILTHFPEKNLSIIVLSNINRTQVKAMSTELSAIAFDEKYELPAFHNEMETDTLALDVYLGKYSRIGQPDDLFMIAREGKRVMIQGPNRSYGFDIFQEAKDRFFAKFGEYYLSFTRDEKGKINRVMIRNEGDISNWKKEQ